MRGCGQCPGCLGCLLPTAWVQVGRGGSQLGAPCKRRGGWGAPYFPEQALRLHCKCALRCVRWPGCKATPSQGRTEEETRGATGKAAGMGARPGRAGDSMGSPPTAWLRTWGDSRPCLHAACAACLPHAPPGSRQGGGQQVLVHQPSAVC